MNFENGFTYRFVNLADPNRALNVYAADGTAPQLANVCLWEDRDDDTCQQWTYKVSGSNKYLACKNNLSVALDLFTDSSAGSLVNNYNAHVYPPSETSYITFEDSHETGYVKIKLSQRTNKYLTANQGSNGTASGKDVNAAGNVYWYKGGLTDGSQDWKPIKVKESGGGTLKGNYLTYPTKVMRITQTYNDDLHYPYSHGTPRDYPIDEADKDGGARDYTAHAMK